MIVIKDIAATQTPTDRIILDYDERFLRRKRLMTDNGATIYLDFPQAVRLQQGQSLFGADASEIAVIAAHENVLIVRGDNLAQLAWHIGNRHTPCEIHDDHLVIRFDVVLANMLRGLGADVQTATQAFAPEPGAYAGGHHHHD